MNRLRKVGENYKQYRFNLKNEEFATKEKLRPKLLWNSHQLGQYVFAKRGPL